MQRYLVAAILLLLATSVVVAQPAPPPPGPERQPRLLTVTGNGDVFARPDRATVRLGVDTQAKTLQAAQDENARAMGQVIGRIRALGVPDRNIQTATFSVYPITESQPNRPDLPVIVGYRVSNVVSVRLENLTLVGRVVDAALAAGANRVEGISFELRDDLPLRQEALRAAADEAKSKARTLAEAAGVRLGPIYSISEGGVSIVQPFQGGFARAAAEAAPTPVLPGEIQVRAGVTIAYVIE